MRVKVMQAFYIVLLVIITLHITKRTLQTERAAASKDPIYTAEITEIPKDKKSIDFKDLSQYIGVEEGTYYD